MSCLGWGLDGLALVVEWEGNSVRYSILAVGESDSRSIMFNADVL